MTVGDCMVSYDSHVLLLLILHSNSGSTSTSRSVTSVGITFTWSHYMLIDVAS